MKQFTLITSILFYLSYTILEGQSYHKVFPLDQDLGTYTDLQVNKLNGDLYAITSCGELIKSTNEGQNWDKIKDGFSSSTSSELIIFPNEAGTYVHKTYSSVMEITKDDGVTWSNIKPAGSYYSMSIFEGGKIIVPTNMGVQISYDYGSSWQLDTLLKQRSYLSFIDSNTGFLMNIDGDLWKTTDAAKTWTQIYTETSSFRTSQIHFFTPLMGYRKESTDLEKTVDGGLSWTHISGYPVLYEMEFIDSMNFLTYHGGSVFSSADAGVTWTAAEPKEDFAYVSSTFRDINNVFVAGSRKALFKTADMGETWVEKSSAPVMGYIADFEFINKDLGLFVSYDSSMVFTKDGGETWETKKESLYDEIAITSDGKAYLFGESGIAYTTDLVNYTVVSASRAESGNEYTFSPNGTLYCILSQVVKRSVDKGITWDTIKIVPERYISSLHVRSDQKIVFTTSTGFVYYTDNGGSSWDSSEVNAAIHDINWLSETEAYLTCSDSIRHTTDKFQTFRGTSRRFYGFKGVQSVSADTVYSYYGSSAIYGPGYIKMSSDGGATYKTVYNHCFALGKVAAQPGSNNLWIVSDGGEVGFYGTPTGSGGGGMKIFQTKEQNMLVYPNPVAQTLHFELNNGSSTEQLFIYDVSGKLVVSMNNPSEINSIPLGDFKSGVYLLEIISEGKSFTRKFVKI